MTLFKFKQKPLEIKLFTDSPAVFEFCRPQKAINFAPEWWKKLPKRTAPNGGDFRSNNSSTTMKTCSGFVDLYASGFIQPLWSDLRVDIFPDGAFHYQFADKLSSAQRHPEFQMEGSPLTRTHTHLKLHSPWFVQGGDDTRFLACPPTWNNFGDGDVCAPPGIMSFERAIELNVNTFFKRHPEVITYELNFGQPIAHFIPLSDRPIKLDYELVSKEERGRILRRTGVFFFFENRMRKAAKLCPHG